MGMADDNQKKFNQETINKRKTQTQQREGRKGNKLKTVEERGEWGVATCIQIVPTL